MTSEQIKQKVLESLVNPAESCNPHWFMDGDLGADREIELNWTVEGTAKCVIGGVEHKFRVVIEPVV